MDPDAKPKMIVIAGPTASGKSSLAVTIAKKHDGEVISADSRQVYEGLDIASGKITPEEIHGVKHHLLDVARPEDEFNVTDFKRLADEAVFDILQRDKLPILAGGTGFYIQAVVDDVVFPDVEPNEFLRRELAGKSAQELFEMLQEKDPRRAEEIDENNPRRLIRALEIVDELGEVPKLDKQQRFNTLMLALKIERDQLRERITVRTDQRFEEGMIEEAKQLHANGLSLERMNELGLEYRFLAQFLADEISKEDLREKIITGDYQYAMRQLTWFKKGNRYQWVDPFNTEDILKQVKQFLVA